MAQLRWEEGRSEIAKKEYVESKNGRRNPAVLSLVGIEYQQKRLFKENWCKK